MGGDGDAGELFEQSEERGRALGQVLKQALSRNKAIEKRDLWAQKRREDRGSETSITLKSNDGEVRNVTKVPKRAHVTRNCVNKYEEERARNAEKKEDTLLSRFCNGKDHAWRPDSFFTEACGKQDVPFPVRPQEIFSNPQMCLRIMASQMERRQKRKEAKKKKKKKKKDKEVKKEKKKKKKEKKKKKAKAKNKSKEKTCREEAASTSSSSVQELPDRSASSEQEEEALSEDAETATPSPAPALESSPDAEDEDEEVLERSASSDNNNAEEEEEEVEEEEEEATATPSPPPPESCASSAASSDEASS